MVYTQKQIEQIRDDNVDGYDVIVRKVRNYDDDQPLKMITARQQHQLYGRVPNAMSDNVMKVVLTSTASLLVFEEWDVEGAEVNDQGVPESEGEIDSVEDDAHPVKIYLDDFYMRNQLRKKQYHVHRSTLRDGNHGMSLACRNNRILAFREPYWDGDVGIFVAYDVNGDYEFVVREWWEMNWKTNTKIKRRNVFYPDMFQRFVQNGNKWEPIKDADESTPKDAKILTDGSVPWLKLDGSPLGIPIVHFANDSRNDSEYGRSDIAGVLGIQDDINSMQHDISATAKFTGFQQLWGKLLGLNGKKLLQGPGMAHEFTSPDAELYVIPAGDMSGLMDAHAYKRKTMAINTDTPMPTVDGAQWPTGEALLQFKQPQFNKAIRLGNSVGPSWTLLGHRSVEMANAFLGMNLDEDAPISTVFGDVRQLDEITVAKSKAEEARAMEIVSRIQDIALIEELGFLDPKTIEKLREERSTFGPEGDETAGVW